MFLRKKEFARRRGIPYPPGPPPQPIIGHLFKIPKAPDEQLFTEYAEKYGDIVYLHLLGKDILILNTERCAVDLFEKRGTIYSNRPWLPVTDMMGWSDILSLLPYGPLFYKTRKLFQAALSKSECLTYQEIQLRQVRILLQSLLKDPSDFELHLTRFSNAIITEVTYGHKINSSDDPYVAMIDELFSIVNGLGDPGMIILDLFPFLRHIPSWVPGAWYAKYAKKYRPKAEAIMDEPFAEVQDRVSQGTAEASFLTYQLGALQNEGPINAADERRLKMDAFQLYMAGAETTSSTMLMFLIAMVYNPGAQKIAQDELDKVVGPGRLPDFSDREALPYLSALVNEVFRWKPVAPLGLPHSAMQDDIYNNMFIPKGATIIPNLRYMLSDPNTYHDPQSFKPERFLPKPHGYGEPLPTSVFGFGRRSCPGKLLGEASVWIAIASILATFDVKPLEDSKGNILLPPMEFDVHITSRPKPFQCLIKPRISQHELTGSISKQITSNLETFYVGTL
ncbi:cytochrome P450 family protein [Abortiporus biennis]